MTMIASPCEACQHWNMPGSLYCEVCGNPLSNGASPLGQPRVINIGRDASNDFVVAKQTVSGRHAQLEVTADGQLILRDLGSMNRTFVNAPMDPVALARVNPNDVIFLGRQPVPVYQILAQQDQSKQVQRKPESVAVQMKSPRVVFGRDPQCDYPLSHPMISWRHAILYRSNDNRYFIEDLQSRNGTYLNGKKIAAGKRVEVRIASDEISFGSYSFRLSGVGTIEARETGREIRVMAKGIAVAVPSEAGGTKMILEDASLAIEPGDLVALMGPSGAGKTTLLCALNGIVTPAAGQVLYQRGSAAPVELRRHYEQLRPLIGYVPQDDIMHPQLTVFEALYYAARLRLPSDYTDPQIHQRIQTVLSDIGLWEEFDPERAHRRLLQHTIIGDAVRRGISGGQRKRVNFAMELLSEPALLFLDEPTSGLSSIDARQVVSTLRNLTEAGCTIIVTIHQPSMEVYQLFTLLALVSNHPRTKGGNKEIGKLVYFGPTQTAFDFFACDKFKPGGQSLSPEEIETALLKQPVDYWFQRYQTYGGLAEHYGSKLDGSKKTGPAELPPVKRDHLAQTKILTQRYFKLKWRDHTQMALAIGLPIVFGALVAASQRFIGKVPSHFSDLNDWTQFIRKIGTLQFLMVVASFWFGCNNAIRELVGERAIYRRERMVNLSIFAYLNSKYVVLGALALLQCAIMLGIAYFGAEVKAEYYLLLLTLWITALAGTGLGVCLSAALPTTEAAIASLPLVLLPMIVLGGGMTTLADMDREGKHVLRAVSDVAVPTRWAYEANMLEETRAQKIRGTSAEILPYEAAAASGAPIPPARSDNVTCGDPPDKRCTGSTDTCVNGIPRPDVAALAFPTEFFETRSDGTKCRMHYKRHTYGGALGRLGIFAGLFAILGAIILKLDEVAAWKGFLNRMGHTWREMGPGLQVLVLGLIVAALVVISFLT
jgi:ABC-type multidrug transport system ATPase subunit/pSer/pThr/pTyr-binding forkhead associated (FHA) protein